MATDITRLQIQIDTSQVKKASDSFDNMNKSVNNTEKGLLSLNKVIGALSLTALTSQLVKYADEFTNINNRLRLATDGTNELATAQKELFKISQDTMVSFSSSAELYSKLKTSTDNLNISQERLLKITQTINKAGLLGGGSVESVNAALVQLGQGLASGTLRGDELNSVLENTPRLARAIAEGMNVPLGKIRELAGEGKITAETIIKALESQGIAIDKEFEKVGATIGQAMQTVSNSILFAVGTLDEGTGASKSFADSIMSLSKLIDENRENILLYAQGLASIIATVTALAVGKKALSAVTQLYNSYLIATTTTTTAYNIATNTATATTTRMSLSQQAAAASSLALSTAMRAIPFIAVAGGIFAITDALIKSKGKMLEFGDATTSTADKLKGLTSVQLDYQESLLQTEIIQKRLDLANAKSKASSQGIFQSDEDFLRARSEADKTSQEFEQLTKSLRDLKKVREDLSNTKPVNDKLEVKNAQDLKAIQQDLLKVIDPYAVKVKEINQKYDDMLIKLKMVKGSTADIAELEKARQIELDKAKPKETKTSSPVKIEQTKEQLITSSRDWQTYYETIKDYSSSWAIEEADLRARFIDLNAEQMDIMLQDAKTRYFDKFKEEAEKIKEIKPFDFSINLDVNDTAINSVLKSFESLTDAQQEYNKFINKEGVTKEQIAKADEKNISNQIKGYSNLAGSIGELFEAGSRESASFKIAQTALALVEGTRAILTAGTGDPYTAIPRMIAMGAMVSSLLGNIGVAFGTSSVSSVNMSAPVNTGTGTVLGDSEAVSESITKSLEILEDFAEPQYQTLQSMNKYLANISNALGGVSSLLIRQGGFAFGEGFTPTSTTKQNIKINNDIANAIVGGGVGLVLSKLKIPIISDIAGMFGGLINNVMGGLFGKTSVSSTMTDSGIYFANQLLTDAIENFNGSAYQTIQTTVSKKSWFGSSSSTTITDYFQALDNETERQFSLVLGGLYDTALQAGTALDMTAEDTEKKLSKFIVSIGKISLKGKTGEQIQESLTNVFGKLGDQIALEMFNIYDTVTEKVAVYEKRLVGGFSFRLKDVLVGYKDVTTTKVVGNTLVDFQKVGEGLFQTMTRVATGMEEARFYIDRLGKSFNDLSYTEILNKQGDVGFEALYQSIKKTDEALYGVDNNLIKIIENLDSTAEELYTAYSILDTLRSTLSFLGLAVEGISTSSIRGAGSLENLSSGINDYIENFLSDEERLSYKTMLLTKEFDRLGISLPTSKDAFKTLINSLDLTTEDGQKLYGSLITLSGAFSDVSDEAEKLTNVTITLLSNLSQSIKNVVATLRGNNSSVSLSQFNQAMLKAIDLSTTTNYQDFANAVNEAIKFSSALSDESNFKTAKEMSFAQSVAANQFEDLGTKTETQIDILMQIRGNTAIIASSISGANGTVNSITTPPTIGITTANQTTNNPLIADNSQTERLINIVQSQNVIIKQQYDVLREIRDLNNTANISLDSIKGLM